MIPLVSWSRSSFSAKIKGKNDSTDTTLTRVGLNVEAGFGGELSSSCPSLLWRAQPTLQSRLYVVA